MEIKQLSSDVVDKIAAGEVVERPSHLLKELIENSLDAGATTIDIDIDEGGKSISVIDNGKGVLASEFPLVFARHATSKIIESEDLWNLNSFGFRGEALASISSVCRLDFISRRQGDKKAFRMISEFGQLSEIMEASSQEGTQVKITDLFSNIPARLKFLKSDSAEVTQIKNVIKALALQYSHVEWKLKLKGKILFFWPKEKNPIERAKKVLEIENLYENELDYEGFKVRVFFADPANVVKVSKQIWIFVQNRWVQDRGIQAAVMQAYRSLLMHGQFPICVVSLHCPPDEVDVNIHPTKSQVKFLDQQKAFRATHYALREAIEVAPWNLKNSAMSSKIQGPIEMTESFNDTQMSRTQFKKKAMNYQKEESPAPHVGLSELKRASLREFMSPGSDVNSKMSLLDRESSYESFSEYKEKDSELNKINGTQKFWSNLQVIGQLDLTYIVVQAQDRMMLVDQHAAHERVAYEKLMKSWKEGNTEVQSLLLPLTLDLEEQEVEALLKNLVELEKMGVSIEQAGPASLAIQTLPSIITEKGLVEALQVLAREILEKGGSFAFETALSDLFATMACHSVVRAGQALSLEEMSQLLIDMDEFPLSGFCPHGRRVSLEFPFLQIEKDFGRRG